MNGKLVYAISSAQKLFHTNVIFFSDIVDYSYVRNSLEPLLRTLIPSNSSTSYIFPKIFYFPIKVNSLTRIRIYIKDNQLRLLSTLTVPVSVTLHFRKHRK